MAKVAVIKTKENDSSVEDFIGRVKDEQQRKDSLVILKLMKKSVKKNQKCGAHR